MVQPFNLRLARYRSHVQKVAVHGDGGSAWRMQAPYVPGATSPLVNPNADNWGKDKPTPGGTTNLDDRHTQHDNVQRYVDDEDAKTKLMTPPEKLYKVMLAPGHQMTPELAKEVEDWKSNEGTTYVIVDSLEKVEDIRRRVPGVIVEERGE
jgi:hypothetical protein